VIPIEMFSGTTVNLLDPDPETIRLDDIAHHIARIHRYTGGTEWSVAAHSLCVAMLVPPEFKLEALLHDAHEAYVGDVSAPVKAAMRELVVIEQYEGSVFDLIEEDFERVVREKFRLPDEKSEEVHRADMVMCVMER
jgi:5'-deoxynucleotidase YfbR-like HD superfamily hydrolase